MLLGAGTLAFCLAWDLCALGDTLKMSENSSDSDSSCGWTVINHEGSDIETAVSENGGTTSNHEFASEEYITLQEEEEQPLDSSIEGNKDGASSMVETPLSALEETKAGPEAKKESVPDDGSCIGANSDDSDIVTLETPKAEEVPTQEEAVVDDEEAQSSEDFNMGSSSSSQYTFCQPETVFPSQPADDESSSDETSNQSSPALRRRRAKKRLASSSESEVGLSNEQENVPPKEERQKRQFSSGLNRCIILALVIAVSMGFGHFYGTIQIQKRQQLVEKTHEDELNGMKDDLYQCQQQQEVKGDHKVGSLKEDLATCLISTEVEKKSFEFQKRSLATENQHLRESLENEEKALASLQEELRKLRQQIRNLEDKEAQMLRRELDKERQITEALKEELEQLSSRQTPSDMDTDKTFDAMKNSTKEFVRHHKEKIKQAKEAVKENLKKFSDSVKSTFRHFKDTTKNIFDEKEKKPGDKRYEANKKARTVYREYKPHECYKHMHHRGPSMQNDFKEGRKQRPTEFTTFEKDTNSQKCLNDPLCNRKPRSVLKGCSGIFECAHQEFISLFNKDYLEEMKEYQNDDEEVFEDLDKYIYRYYFHYNNSPQFGPSQPSKRPSFIQSENSRHEKQAQKYHQRNKREEPVDL
ncbi:cell cycle progression protein 1 [Alligator mississippiensis]|uniref:Cell cycle progression protein 1 n=1 Tax=Alligator mississippiensis TaxID=8496 RepID=A0A151M9W8_ALLMI|nr:cell cycle progression protein 1 [Alligator mississippiensis]